MPQTFEDGGDFGFRSNTLCWHINAKVLVGAAIAATISATSRFSHTAAQTAASAADAFSHHVYLQAGTYDFSAIGTTDAAMGIVDWFLDGVKIVSLQDWYAAAPVENVVKTTSVVVPTDGWHRLMGKVNGHNAAPATDYILALIYYRFNPTA